MHENYWDPADAMTSRGHYRESGNSYAWISTDQGQFTLGFDGPVAFLPGQDERRDRCGSSLLDGERYDGLCYTCADET